ARLKRAVQRYKTAAQAMLARRKCRTSYFLVDFLRDDLRPEDFRLEDFLPEDFFFEDDFFAGTLAPSRRASDKPIAIACLRLFTVLPERPLFSLPRLRSCMARFTF